MNSSPYPEGFFTTWTQDERNAYFAQAGRDYDARNGGGSVSRDRRSRSPNRCRWRRRRSRRVHSR